MIQSLSPGWYESRQYLVPYAPGDARPIGIGSVEFESCGPLEVQDTVAAADRHEFRYEVLMSGDR